MTVKMKAIEWFFHTVLYCMSVNEVLAFDYLNEWKLQKCYYF